MQVHGKIILGFPFGDKEIKKHCCDFYLRDDSHNFIIDIDEYPIEKLMNYYVAMSRYTRTVYSVMMKMVKLLRLMSVIQSQCRFLLNK